MSRLPAPGVLASAAALALALPGVAAAEEGRWRHPLPGAELVGAFDFDRGTPYAGGQRRGIDLRGKPGETVRAACSGRVAYAGRIPGRGLGVTVRCGALLATHLGLGATSARIGAPVAAGAPIGRLGASGVLRLGARRAGERHGYVDPETLLDGPAEPPPTAPPAGLRPRPRPAPEPVRTRPVRRAPASAPAAVPAPAWAGVALLLAAGSGGAVGVRRRRARRAASAALAGR